MGSKALLLQKGLGTVIEREALSARRFVDLFTGAAHVAHFAACRTNLPVVAIDLQNYAISLAGAVIERTKPLDPEGLEEKWLQAAEKNAKGTRLWKLARMVENEASISVQVGMARQLSAQSCSVGPVLGSYGGHYFSPAQALMLDHMIDMLPGDGPSRKVALATIICVASRCAAAPGHTAQPFQPTEKGERYLKEAWRRDPVLLARRYLNSFCSLFSNSRGNAFTFDAVKFSKKIRPTDLVFVDPPYSDVQYSRFYHVLETIALGHCGHVTGSGRYPPVTERPQSDFSKRTTSLLALESLLGNLSSTGARVILTFPAGDCSNGISGQTIVEGARRLFRIRRFLVNGSFSTLGGNHYHRKPTQESEELILILKPKARAGSKAVRKSP